MACYHILQPTRVTEHTDAVIDNIFSNNLQDDIVSGNVLLTLSEHFSQFASVNGEKIELKKIHLSERLFKVFKWEFLRYVSIQNWNYTHTNVHDSFKDFYTKLEGSVNRHAQLKKLTPKEIKLKK